MNSFFYLFCHPGSSLEMQKNLGPRPKCIELESAFKYIHMHFTVWEALVCRSFTWLPSMALPKLARGCSGVPSRQNGSPGLEQLALCFQDTNTSSAFYMQVRPLRSIGHLEIVGPLSCFSINHFIYLL